MIRLASSGRLEYQLVFFAEDRNDLAVIHDQWPLEMSRFLAGMVCGALLLFVVMRYHIVREDKGIILVPKISNNLSGIYTDVRNFKLEDWKNNRALAAAIMKSSHADLISESAHRNFGEALRRRVDEFLGS